MADSDSGWPTRIRDVRLGFVMADSDPGWPTQILDGLLGSGIEQTIPVT